MGDDPVGGEKPQGVAGPYHVGHGVQSAHLVVVDLAHGAAVGLGLGLGDGVIDAPGADLDLIRQVHAVDEVPDVVGRGVVMVVFMAMVVIVYVVMLMHVVMDVVVHMEMGHGVSVPMLVVVTVMVMIMVVVPMVVVVVVPLLMAMDGHRHVGAGDAAGHRRLRRHVDAGETQAVHFVQKGGLLLLAQKFKEGGGEHVPGAPHGAFDVKGFHVTSPPVLPFD